MKVIDEIELNHRNRISSINQLRGMHKKEFYKLSFVLLKEKLLFYIKHKKASTSKFLIKYSIILSAVIFPTLYFINNPNIIVLHGAKPKPQFVYVDNHGKGNNEFLKDLGFFESGGKYSPSGNENYWGKYQIGRAALSAVGFEKITKDEFIQDTMLQEVTIRRLMSLNKRVLSNLIGKWEGKTLAGIYITQSGLLAAAHLGGCSNVRNFLESNGAVIFKDGNGTPITKYMKHFSNYKLKF